MFLSLDISGGDTIWTQPPVLIQSDINCMQHAIKKVIQGH